MKRSAISALGLAFSMIALAFGSSVCDNAPCEPLINAAVGEEFKITVPFSPSTEFGWWSEFDPQILSLVRTESTTGNTNLAMVGLPEQKIFTYRALAASETEVYLLFLQPWENGSIAQRLIFPVIITE